MAKSNIKINQRMKNNRDVPDSIKLFPYAYITS